MNAERRQSLGREDLQLLLAAAPHPYLVLLPTAAFEIAAANDRYLAVTGTRREDIVGRGLFDVFPDNPDDVFNSGVSDLRASLRRVVDERVQDVMGVQKYDIPRSDGSGFLIKYWSPVNTPVLKSDGSLAYIIHHVEDITDLVLSRHLPGGGTGIAEGGVAATDSATADPAASRQAARMEAEVMLRAREVKEANRQLKLAVRTLQLRESELAQLNTRLGNMNRVRAEFLANMSHEIRTPMNAVIGMTTLLINTNLSAEQRDYVDTIRTSGDHLLTIINDILDFSKIEAGKLELEQRPFSLRDCLEGALELVSVRAAQKGLELLLLMDHKAPRRVVGDISRLRQIVLNLVDNAVKFTEAGEVIVTVRSDRCGETGTGGNGEERRCKLTVSVRDTGVGLSQEQAQRLFTPFGQAEASTSRMYGGTGLGLVICKRLVEMMDGTIRVEPANGHGATFTFDVVLPLVPDEPVAAIPKQLVGRSALVVDDNATNRLILERFLTSWAMRSRLCASAAEALQALAGGEHFDIALLDYQMPQLNGAELARAIRQLPEGRALPLILLSSTAARDPGQFAEVLHKPVRASLLFDALMRVLEPAVSIHPDQGRGSEDRPGQTQPMRILVAEDNIVNQKVIRLLLGKLGYEADLVGDGKEVLEALGRVAYDAVLMDVQMPDMDGLEATRQITARWPPQRRPYVIGLTAHAMSEARQACLAAGMDDYLAKPVVYDKLREVLQRCWNSRVASNADSGVDEATLRRLLKLIGPEELREVIDIYFSQAAQHLSSAQRLADTGDVGEVCKIVHSLKSSSAQLGAVRVKQLCEQLEIDCRSGTVSDLRGRVAEIQTAFGLARRVLEQDRSRPAEGRATDG